MDLQSIKGGVAHSDITERLLNLIAREGMVPQEKLTADATLESLGITSIDFVTILMGIEEEFDVYLPVEGRIVEAKNIGDLTLVLTDLIANKSTGEPANG